MKKPLYYVKELLKLAPNEAVRIENGIEKIIAIDDIKLGDLLRVKPGDKIPVDGRLAEVGIFLSTVLKCKILNP